ncbi:hypothetical protein [Stenotrophomonas phage RAS14]
MDNKNKFLDSEFLVNSFSIATTYELKVRGINNLAWNIADTVHYPDEFSNIIRRKRAIHILEYYP